VQRSSPRETIVRVLSVKKASLNVTAHGDYSRQIFTPIDSRAWRRRQHEPLSSEPAKRVGHGLSPELGYLQMFRRQGLRWRLPVEEYAKNEHLFCCHYADLRVIIRHSRIAKMRLEPDLIMKQYALRPTDIGVALGLVECPNATYQRLHEMLGVSVSTAHDSVQRLREAGLVRQDDSVVVRSNLLEFLEHGVRYAFPALLGASARGVPTSHSGPALADDILAEDVIVWPCAKGPVVGRTVCPLYPNATELPKRAPNVYAMLTLVDALRVGRIRERKLASAKLRAHLYGESATTESGLS
jgi:DNA-binding MarR family transcriptional regulator